MNPSKTIRSPSDLAINGALPAFGEPVHVGRPNIGDRTAFLRRTEDILDRRWLSNNGPMVDELESRIARLLGVKHCVAMCNGTIALEIAIRALGLVGEIIVPSYTFIATAHAVAWQGITPVFADINRSTHTLNPEAVRRMITPRTSGILATHLWGRSCEIEALQGIADEHGLSLIFDAAHAFLCTHGQKKIAGFGRAEVFSFHATKFFNTFEGGAVTTNDDDLAEKMRLMRNFGFKGYDNVIYSGTNGKMTEICAAMGLTNLESIDAVLAANQRNYFAYREEIDAIPGLKLFPFDTQEENNYQYVVLEVTQDFPVSRDHVVQALHAENILVRKYFWPGCHRMKPYRDLYPNANLCLGNTEAISEKVVVLPTGTTLPPAVIEVIRDVLLALMKKS